MRKILVALLALGAAGLVSSAASAQTSPFGTEGQMAFSADRLFGFYGYSLKSTIKEQGVETEQTVSGSDFNFLWGGSQGYGGANPQATPRLSFDYFIAESISLGGSLGYIHNSGEVETKQGGNSESRDTPTTSGFAFAPRVGYAYMFNETIGIWPRGGFSYLTTSTTAKSTAGESTDSTWLLDLDIEGMLVITPVNNFAFVVGPVIDIGLTGKSKTENKPNGGATTTTENDSTKLTTFGIAAGMLGYF